MQKIRCEIKNLSQRFQHFYLFRELSFEMESGEINLVKGSNGSGKSTFLKILSGGMEAWEGEIQYEVDSKKMELDFIWQNISFLAPYQELPEELNLKELIDFQIQIHPAKNKTNDYHELADRFGLKPAMEKPISHFSTGMKQKAKIVLALGEKRPIWILDEPNSNLDVASSQLLWDWLKQHKNQHLIVVASNDPTELAQGKMVLDLEKN